MTAIRKAYAYILRNRNGAREFLVFRHRDYPDAGVQVPKGTMLPDETPEDAVLREAREETGLGDFGSPRPLATDIQPQPDGTLHERHFFALAAPIGAADAWEHVVTGDG